MTSQAPKDWSCHAWNGAARVMIPWVPASLAGARRNSSGLRSWEKTVLWDPFGPGFQPTHHPSTHLSTVHLCYQQYLKLYISVFPSTNPLVYDVLWRNRIVQFKCDCAKIISFCLFHSLSLSIPFSVQMCACPNVQSTYGQCHLNNIVLQYIYTYINMDSVSWFDRGVLQSTFQA